MKKPNEWIIVHVVNKEIVNERCTTIEIAADFMLNKLGIKDEDIDEALCEMSGYDHNRAIFVDRGYSHSEEK